MNEGQAGPRSERCSSRGSASFCRTAASKGYPSCSTAGAAIGWRRWRRLEHATAIDHTIVATSHSPSFENIAVDLESRGLVLESSSTTRIRRTGSTRTCRGPITRDSCKGMVRQSRPDVSLFLEWSSSGGEDRHMPGCGVVPAPRVTRCTARRSPSDSLRSVICESAPRASTSLPSAGITWSEFHDVTGTRDKMNGVPGILWLRAEAVAREGYDAVMTGHPVVVNGAIYRFLVWLNGAMPRGISRWVSGRAGRQYRKV